MSSQNGKALVRRLGEALNAGDLDAVDGILDANYIRNDPSDLLRDAGVEECKQAFRQLLRAFPDAHWTLEDLLQDGDRVIGRWSFRGTQEGPFFDMAPTGRVVTYPIIDIYRVEDGRIAEDWHVFHALGLWQRLIPEIGALIKRARG